MKSEKRREKRMRRLAVLLTAGAMLLAAAGCAKKEAAETTAAETTGVQTTEVQTTAADETTTEAMTEAQTAEEAAEESAEAEETTAAESAPDGTTAAETTVTEETTAAERETLPAIDFSLRDQYGTLQNLAAYRGKIIFLNFWATWCGPCREEMPYIQNLYEKYLEEEDSDVVILSVATPGLGGEGSQQDIEAFLNENGYTYPVIMDPEGTLLQAYGITAFPTTYMIDPEGNIYGYMPGSMDQRMMEAIIRKTRDASSKG